jgi:hypothetical protein
MTSWWCANSSYICNGYQQRVVDVPGVSMELCGGTHLTNTSEIGLFKIVAESGMAAGIRSIEAVAGPAVLAYLNERDAVVRALGDRFKTLPGEIVERLAALQEELRGSHKAPWRRFAVSWRGPRRRRWRPGPRRWGPSRPAQPAPANPLPC